MHLMNHNYFDYEKNLKTLNLNPMPGSKWRRFWDLLCISVLNSSYLSLVPLWWHNHTSSFLSLDICLYIHLFFLVIIFLFHTPPSLPPSSPSISSAGTVLRLKGSILTMGFLDCNGSLIHPTYDAWKDMNRDSRDTKDKSKKWRWANDQCMATSPSTLLSSRSQNTQYQKLAQFQMFSLIQCSFA